MVQRLEHGEMTTAERVVDLSGTWRLAQLPDHPQDLAAVHLGDLDFIDAQVPGAVPYDLVDAGRLENPFASKAAANAAAWVAGCDWVYARSFDAPVLPPLSRAFLRLNGVDTFADVYVNGRHVGSTDDALMPFEFEIDRSLLRPEGNQLVVHVRGHFGVVEDQVEGLPFAQVHTFKSLIRRYPRSFFCYGTNLLNLGTAVISIGIFRSIELVVTPQVRLADCWWHVADLSSDEATLVVGAELDGATSSPKLTVDFVLSDASGEHVAAASVDQADAAPSTVLRIPHPKLWWPTGHGEPYRYHLRVAVRKADTSIATAVHRVGIKSVALERVTETGRATFRFIVNGKPIYVRGANLVPVDYLQPGASADDEEWLLQLARHASMNMLRLWGGGVPAEDRLLERCDELGIMVWQDFYFHSAPYPDHDPKFVAKIQREARAQLGLVRQHACLTLLCGGNEQIEGWKEWNWQADLDRFYGERLIDEVLPQICASYCPDVPYIPNSPHGGRWSKSPVEGDTHSWGNFYNATKDPLFVTETTWSSGSYSRPETLKERMGLDAEALSGRGWHNTWHDLTDQSLLSDLAYSEHHVTESLVGYLQALEVEQGEGEYQGLSMLRLHSPACSGVLYWCLNKGAPLFMPGCIDYHGRPLRTYYNVKRAFADVTLGVYRDIADVRVVASSVLDHPVQATLRVLHLRADGDVLGLWEKPVTLTGAGTDRLLDIEGLTHDVTHRTQELVYAELIRGQDILATDTHYFCLPSEFACLNSAIRARATAVKDGTWLVELESDAVATGVVLTSASRMVASDGQFALLPGRPRSVLVQVREDDHIRRAVSLDIWSLNAPRTNIQLERTHE